MSDRKVCGQANCSGPACKSGVVRGNRLAMCAEYLSVLTDKGVPACASPCEEPMAISQLQEGSDDCMQRVQECVAKAVAAREKGFYEEASRTLAEGRGLLQQCGQQSPLLCMHMGQVQAYFGKWREAEAELRQGLYFQMHTDPTSELALQLSNSLIELYHQRELDDRVIEQGEWTLKTWRDSPHTFELLRAVFFLADTYYEIQEEGQGFALVEEWTNSAYVDDLSRYMLLLIKRSRRHEEKNNKDQEDSELVPQFPSYAYITAYAKQQLEPWKNMTETIKTANTYLVHFPHATKTLCYSIAVLSKYWEIVKSEVKISANREVLSPLSLSLCSAFFLIFLGDLEMDYERTDKARQLYLQANDLLSTRYSHTIEYAHFLSGALEYQPRPRIPELAMDQYEKAYQLYISFLPNSIGLLRCLKRLNISNSEREGKYLQLYEVYKERFSQSRHFVEFLLYSYHVFKDLHMPTKKCLEALQVSTMHFPHTKALARCLHRITWLSYKQNSLNKAKKYNLQACQIVSGKSWMYTVHAMCLHQLAQFYDRKEKAIQCYVQICELYEAHSPSAFKYHQYLCALSDLYADLDRVEAAEECCLKAFRVTHSDSFQGDIEALQRLGERYVKVNKIQLAKQYYKKACVQLTAFDPSSQAHADCLKDLGLCYERENRQEEAARFYLKACEISVTLLLFRSVSYLECLSGLYAKMHKEKALEEHYMKACLLGNSDVCSKLRACWTLAEWGKLHTKELERCDAQISQCLATIDLSTLSTYEHSLILGRLGKFHEQVNKHYDIERCFLKACQILAAQKNIHYRYYHNCHTYLAELYESQRRNTEAEEYYLKALVHLNAFDFWKDTRKLCKFFAETGKADLAEQCAMRNSSFKGTDCEWFRRLYA